MLSLGNEVLERGLPYGKVCKVPYLTICTVRRSTYVASQCGLINIL